MYRRSGWGVEMDYEMLEEALRIIRSCGDRLRNTAYHEVQHKGCLYDMVSDMDIAIEQKIIQELHTYYPTHTFLCEEGTKELSTHTWIVDPIDGTTNYISKHRDFAISCAYYEERKPMFGIVYDVMRDELFYAIEGVGAFCNGQKMAPIVLRQLHECIFDVSLRSVNQLYKTKQIDLLPLCEETRGHRSLNCASLAICHIAQGINDIYLSNNVKCWDYAAADIILRACGGTRYIEQDFFTTNSTIALFTNHQSILKHIQETYLKG